MENSGKLVTLVRQNAKGLAEENDSDLVLVDGPPGIGCPAIASLSNVEFSLIVVEPTLSGIHDLKRALELLYHFDVAPLVCINKYDLNTDNTDKINSYCKENDIMMIGCVPFDQEVTKAMVQGKPVIEYKPESPASIAIEKTWIETRKHLGV
jgi:MinD superfamily P-loop ATPase